MDFEKIEHVAKELANRTKNRDFRAMVDLTDTLVREMASAAFSLASTAGRIEAALDADCKAAAVPATACCSKPAIDNSGPCVSRIEALAKQYGELVEQVALAGHRVNDLDRRAKRVAAEIAACSKQPSET